MIVGDEKIKVEGNLVFAKQVQMTLDPSALAMTIRNLIRMYENPRMAALREYTSNARDSHRAAGYTGPVEVTLPDRMHPFMTVVDHGVGLSGEEVEGFGQFGRSTKAGSNEYIGGFGLGSKSGLAVSDQFIVTAVKDGVKNVVVVGRDEHNNPSLGFTSFGEDTSDGNGVTVSIPCNAGWDEWKSIAAGKMFIGWEPGSIVIDGRQPELSVHNPKQFKRLKGGWLAVERPQHRAYYGTPVDALVHGVYYQIPADRVPRDKANVLYGSVVEIANGSVDILPSRDNLEWTDKTMQAVRQAMDTLIASIVEEYQTAITQVKTFREAKKIADAMEEIGIQNATLTWKGIDLEWSSRKHVSRDITVGRVKESATAKSGYQNDRHAVTTASERSVHRYHSILVTGATGDSVTAYSKKDEKWPMESSDFTAYILGLEETEGVDPDNVRVYLTNHKKSDLPLGFVSAMVKSIKVDEFVADAKAQRARWAANRATPGTNTRVASPVRMLRVLRDYDKWNGRFSTYELSEATLSTGGEFVLVHSEDALGKAVLEANANGTTHNEKLKALMGYMAQRAKSTNIVVMARNHKAENVTAVNWVDLSTWIARELTAATVRTPMQMRAEAYRATQRGYGAPCMPTHGMHTVTQRIEDPRLREFYDAYVNPIQEGALDAVTKHFPEYAVGQPMPDAFDPHKDYLALGLMDRTSVSNFADTVVDTANALYRARQARLI